MRTRSRHCRLWGLTSLWNWQARDLRKIDSRIPNLVPTILVRKEAVLVCGEVRISGIHVLPSHLLRQVNILHIRALVKADAVILFDTYGSADSRLHSVFLYHLEVSLLISLFSTALLIRPLAQSQSEGCWNALWISVNFDLSILIEGVCSFPILVPSSPSFSQFWAL